MTPPAVALVSSSFAPHFGGVEAHVAHVAAELSDRGHEVEVWTVDRGEHLGPGKVDGIRVRYLATPLPTRTIGGAVRFARSAPAAWHAWMDAYRAFKPDILHVHCYGPNGVYALGLHRRLGTPLIVTSHGETFMDDNFAYRRSALLRRALTAAIAQSSAVTAPSEYVLKDLRRSYGLIDGAVIPNGVDLDVHAEQIVAPSIEPGTYLAAVGRLGRTKGFDLLLAAFARARINGDVRLVVGGDGPELEHLMSQAEGLGIGERVAFTGRLSPSQVAGLMADAVAVVVPSRVEAFGIVALEAWRAGTPVVMTNHGGAREFITDSVDGLLVDPERTGELASVLEQVVVDDGLRARLAANGRERVLDYSWGHTAEAYLGLYGSAIGAT